MLCIWKIEDSGALTKIYSTKLNLGELHSLKVNFCKSRKKVFEVFQFNPDIGSILAVGGSAAELVRIIDLSKFEAVGSAFA